MLCSFIVAIKPFANDLQCACRRRSFGRDDVIDFDTGESRDHIFELAAPTLHRLKECDRVGKVQCWFLIADMCDPHNAVTESVGISHCITARPFDAVVDRIGTRFVDIAG